MGLFINDVSKTPQNKKSSIGLILFDPSSITSSIVEVEKNLNMEVQTFVDFQEFLKLNPFKLLQEFPSLIISNDL